MKPYEITHMIVDEQMDQEHVTTHFTYEGNQYSATFQKSDLELMNSWLLKDQSSLPADLSEELIESLREVIKNSI